MQLPDFVVSLRDMISRNSYRYKAIPSPDGPSDDGDARWRLRDQRRRYFKISLAALLLVGAVVVVASLRSGDGCATPLCGHDPSRLWGQYSPYFPVESGVDPAVPRGCNVTFVQVLSRHGARDPTAGKSAVYKALVERIQSSAESYGRGFEFIENHAYGLGADDLTAFGEAEMVESGRLARLRYPGLAARSEVFVRASGQNRVVVSAEKWTQGFLADESRDKLADILVIPERDGVNNTLSHGLCTEFEDGVPSLIGADAQAAWASHFATAISRRLNRNLPGAKILGNEAIQLMDLCPFETVASRNLTLSPFCSLFSIDEWRSYDYYQSLGKFYGFANGNPLGPTQGVGWANELISRLTGEPVEDHTTTNSTLDASAETFPLDRALYADFSHDNDMSTVFGALGLYNATELLSYERKAPPAETGGYSAAWTVPFAARMYVEKMRCSSAGGDDDEELVRVLVNDRVMPLVGCGADEGGRCRLSRFVESLSFARGGGRWGLCFR